MLPLDWALLPFSRYFDFSGRSPRAEYWYFTAFLWFVTLVLLLGNIALESTGYRVFAVLDKIFGLVTLIPSLAVAVRRLHDINRSGLVLLKYIISLAVMVVLMPFALALIALVPFFGMLATGALILALLALALKFLVLMITESDRGPNLYGPNPYGLTYGY
jgi:uncharacterized membrane protein YhaH (DUF805 family)